MEGDAFVWGINIDQAIYRYKKVASCFVYLHFYTVYYH